MPQLMPLYWCFSIFIFMYVFVMMIIINNENVIIEEMNFYDKDMLGFSLQSWMW